MFRVGHVKADLVGSYYSEQCFPDKKIKNKQVCKAWLRGDDREKERGRGGVLWSGFSR